MFAPSSGFETSVPPLPQLPQFGLTVTNYLQAFILDGGNVIDYVQLRVPASSGNLNWTLADPLYPDETGIFYQWSTNDFPFAPAGVVNQLFVSGHYQLLQLRVVNGAVGPRQWALPLHRLYRPFLMDFLRQPFFITARSMLTHIWPCKLPTHPREQLFLPTFCRRMTRSCIIWGAI